VLEFKKIQLHCVFGLYSFKKMQLLTVFPTNGFFFISIISCMSLLVVVVVSDPPTLRSLSIACKLSKPEELYCGTHPPNCLNGDNYPCELITTVVKFDLPCILGNLNSPYIQSLCSRRHSTYLVSILRYSSLMDFAYYRLSNKNRTNAFN
jgi:hypothetical protein